MGTILWSYLIWVTAEAPSGIVLPPLGGQLYFQWGRKFKEQYYGQVWIWHDEGCKGLQSIHDRALQPLLFHSGYSGFHGMGRMLSLHTGPYYNIDGDMDYQTNFELACEYFSKVNAPEKELLVMKNATHGLLESRSEEFSALLHRIAP